MSKRNARLDALKVQARKLAEKVLCASGYLRVATNNPAAREMTMLLLDDLGQEASDILAKMEIAETPPEAKPRRGRPRKVRPADNGEPKAAEPVPQVKRRRGRPRKLHTPTVSDTVDNGELSSTAFSAKSLLTAETPPT